MESSGLQGSVGASGVLARPRPVSCTDRSLSRGQAETLGSTSPPKRPLVGNGCPQALCRGSRSLGHGAGALPSLHLLAPSAQAAPGAWPADGRDVLSITLTWAWAGLPQREGARGRPEPPGPQGGPGPGIRDGGLTARLQGHSKDALGAGEEHCWSPRCGSWGLRAPVPSAPDVPPVPLGDAADPSAALLSEKLPLESSPVTEG